MIDDRRLNDLLSDVLAVPPRIAPDGLLAATLEDVRVATQRRRRVRSLLPRSTTRRSSAWRLAVVACVSVSVAVVGLSPMAGPVLPSATGSPNPTPASTATPAPARSPFPAIVMDSLSRLDPAVTYTSELFSPRMTFRVNPRNLDGTGDDWCMPIPTSARVMRFHHPKVCRDNLVVVHPASVDCGIPDTHPDAAALAAAILANPRMTRAVDLGSLQTPGAIPDGMFAEAYLGRVVQVNARLAPFVDGHPCLLLDDSGTHALLDITGDETVRLVLVDIHGELVVFGASGATGGWFHLLEINHHIRFD